MMFSTEEEKELLRVAREMQEEAIEDARKYPENREMFYDRAALWLSISEKVQEDARMMEMQGESAPTRLVHTGETRP
jgi:hypothetical protein